MSEAIVLPAAPEVRAVCAVSTGASGGGPVATSFLTRGGLARENTPPAGNRGPTSRNSEITTGARNKWRATQQQNTQSASLPALQRSRGQRGCCWQSWHHFSKSWLFRAANLAR